MNIEWQRSVDEEAVTVVRADSGLMDVLEEEAPRLFREKEMTFTTLTIVTSRREGEWLWRAQQRPWFWRGR